MPRDIGPHVQIIRIESIPAGIDRRFRGVTGARFAQMNGGDIIGIDFLPAIDMVEQLGRRALGAQQGRLVD